VGKRGKRGRELNTLIGTQREANKTHLHGHVYVGWDVENLLDRAIVAFTKLYIELELIHVDIEFGPGRKIDALCMEDSLVLKIEGSRRITAGKRDKPSVINR
jgi:hypothetical protein